MASKKLTQSICPKETLLLDKWEIRFLKKTFPSVGSVEKRKLVYSSNGSVLLNLLKKKPVA